MSSATPSPSREADTSGVDGSVRALRGALSVLAGTGAGERANVLARMRRDVLEASEEWVGLSCAAKGIDPASPTAAEEWLGGPVPVLRMLRLLERSLRHIARTGAPRLAAGEVFERGQHSVVRVFPESLGDRLILPGFTAEAWMEPGLAPRDIGSSMSRVHLGSAEERRPGVCAVLGAGNVSSIGPMDVLSKLFVDNQVCALKLHPVNDYLAPVFERAFAALLERGWLRLVRGGADVGAELVHHPGVDRVHMTGSGAVHDAIVWGSGAEGEQNRRGGTPLLRKPITSELGCVTPILVVPGAWTARELEFQARNVATMVANNASFNCNAAKVLVTCAGWRQREELLSALQRALQAIPPRRAYYPGSRARYAEFHAAHPDAQHFGRGDREHLPWALATGLDWRRREDAAFTREAWCGVLAEVPLPGADGPSFLGQAVRFVNETLYGTLSCGLLIDPRTRAEPAVAPALARALVDLRYGSIALNHWPALSYALGSTTWGAHPGHTLADVGSGIGWVHNTRMFSRVQKSVVDGPFVPRPAPIWVSDHRHAREAARALARYEARPGPVALAALARRALVG